MNPGGPSSLGTLLIQRLDTLLGLTQSQQVNLSSGARPDAVFPAEKGHPGRALQNPGAQPLPQAKKRATQARATTQSGTQHTTQEHRQQSNPQRSIQTHFGRTANLILQLLEQQPQAPALQSGQSLLAHPRQNTPIQQLMQAHQPAQPQAATQTQQTTQTSPIDSSEVQQVLRNELLRSGLFYESLLRQNLQGKQQDKNLLRQQPQNLFQQTSAALSFEQQEPPEPLRPLVRQQFELLATHQWEWRGELWPGVEMLWHYQAKNNEYEPESHQQNSQQGWNSRIQLKFPIGDQMEIGIQWSRTQLDIKITATTQRLEYLKPYTELLYERLRNLNPNPRIQWVEQDAQPNEQQQAPPQEQ